MKTDLLFDFTVDKATKTVLITREFTADLSLVWDAFTKQEILDQWWAPKPWASKTKFMDFKVGGRTSISPNTNFKMLNALKSVMKDLFKTCNPFRSLLLIAIIVFAAS